ncbi:FMN reductase [Antricoccus suffuscus]|uniref:FMN reductase n=1 Tax=Antricoccus suffuscus TaxID=1629062 RepID=A0A2T1A397_9ACTN|nr:NAD(P)H-dependent oxidoreductase [Antricoccus suffuscus]PRZ43073.1 FMN reductase [Antricoccus suffuscus]
MSDPLKVIGVVASPTAGGRTAAAVQGILSGAAASGADTALLELSSAGRDEVIAAIDGADAIVFGSPVYRATYTALLKDLLENVERGKHGEQTAPLRGKAVALTLTGASAHHFLSPDSLRNVLASFFAVQVLSPALYLEHGDFADRDTLGERAAQTATQHGAALVDLAGAVRASKALSTLDPLV